MVFTLIKKNKMTEKCMVSRYDKTISEPPFESNQIDEIDVQVPRQDYLGQRLYSNLRRECARKGYVFKFYTSSDEDKFKYNVFVF